jgi:hypothetical protein
MLKISEKANPNYLCKVVILKGLKKHSNADRLQTVEVDFNTVITGLDAKDGDVYVYFPVEGKISESFLSDTNSFRKYFLNTSYLDDTMVRQAFLDKEENKGERVVGFFEDNCRVKAMKLRGENSMGYIVPSHIISAWAGFNIIADDVDTEFDTISGKLIVEKYQVKVKEAREGKVGQKPKLNRLIEGQVHLHVSTEQLQKNAHKIKPNDLISITYKTHGTSWWAGNVLVKAKLSWANTLGQFLGLNVQDKEHALVYGSRKVVKNKSFEDPKGKDHYFGYDLWEHIKNHVGTNLPKGYTLYGEMLGYDRNGAAIQKGYDYGCTPNGVEFGAENPQSKLEVYRITYTNPDGVVLELGLPERVTFCEKLGLNTPYLFFYGKAKDWLNSVEGRTVSENEHWQTTFVNTLKAIYNENDCYMCTNKVPEEGIVIRKENVFSCDSFKLKSARFLQWETKELDKGNVDMESAN